MSTRPNNRPPANRTAPAPRTLASIQPTGPVPTPTLDVRENVGNSVSQLVADAVAQAEADRTEEEAPIEVQGAYPTEPDFPDGEPESVEDVPGAWKMLRDEKTNSYVRTFVPDAVQVSGVVEPLDKVSTWTELGAVWDEGRGQDMAYRWVNRKNVYSESERRLGWLPVRPDEVPELARATAAQIENDPQLGRIYGMGDVYLAEIPRDQYEARKARERAENNRTVNETMEGSDHRIDEIAKSFSGGNSGLYQSDFNLSKQRFGDDSFGAFGQEAGSEMALAEARSLHEAQARDVSPRAESGGKRVFSGYTGESPYDKWERSGDRARRERAAVG